MAMKINSNLNQHDVSFSGGAITMSHCCFIVDPDAPDVAACPICQNAGPKDSLTPADAIDKLTASLNRLSDALDDATWPEVVLEDILDAEVIGD